MLRTALIKVRGQVDGEIRARAGVEVVHIDCSICICMYKRYPLPFSVSNLIQHRRFIALSRSIHDPHHAFELLEGGKKRAIRDR